MTRIHPKVSIGLPVYNGERYIEETLNSILTQTYEDFELLISDNASNDLTQEICLYYANQDFRIKYHRNNTNLGAAYNFNHTYALSRGKYFKWVAHDDLIDKNFLIKCASVLENDNHVVLCHSRVCIMDENGDFLKNSIDNFKNINSIYPHERFFGLMSIYHSCYDIFGLIRSDALKNTPLIAPYFGSDRNLLVELSLKGKIYRIPECLFFSRDHEGRSIKKIGSVFEFSKWFDPKIQSKFILPIWRHFIEYFKSVNRVELTLKERIKCYVELMRWFKWNWPLLKNDLKRARGKDKTFN